jgi:flagellin
MAEIDVTRIAGNIGAMNALNSLSYINKQLATHQTRLATGKRINTAADDPAGLTIATKMQSRSEGLKTGLSNIADAKNLLAVAESGLGRINDILVQMRNKAQAGGSDTMGAEERDAIKTQIDAYAAQIDDIVTQTKWNGTALIGTASNLVFQVGADSTDTVQLNAIATVNSSGLTVQSSALDTATSLSFRSFMTNVEAAMKVVNAELAKVGALTGRLTFKEDQVSAAQINVEAAYNRIMNANMAEEQVNASKYQILQQTATAMLAQANAAPQFLLSLFR